jgi:hypothetical protein
MPAPPLRRSIGGQDTWMSKTKPSGQVGECAKVRHGFCRYGYTAFNLDSHVVAVAEKKFFHVLDCVGWVPHVSSPKRIVGTPFRSGSPVPTESASPTLIR